MLDDYPFAGDMLFVTFGKRTDKIKPEAGPATKDYCFYFCFCFRFLFLFLILPLPLILRLSFSSLKFLDRIFCLFGDEEQSTGVSATMFSY
jgi:hypothetical protein